MDQTKIILYGSLKTSAKKCHWLLQEIGLEYKTIDLDLRKGENKSPDYLKLNPNGKVPYLIDGDFGLFESMAINTYLVRKYKPELYGEGQKEMALVDQWNYWTTAEYYKDVAPLLVFKLFNAGNKDHIENMVRPKIANLLNLLNKHFEGKTYLLEEKFTFADINLASVVDFLPNLDVDLAKYEHVQKWLNNLIQKPSYPKN